MIRSLGPWVGTGPVMSTILAAAPVVGRSGITACAAFGRAEKLVDRKRRRKRSSVPAPRGRTAAGPRRLLKEYSGPRTWCLRAFRQGTTRSRSRAGTAAEGGGPTRRDDGSTARAPTRSVGRHVPNTMADMILRLCGLGWHGPLSDHPSRGPFASGSTT